MSAAEAGPGRAADAGVGVVITRDEPEEDGRLGRRLAALGLVCHHWPTIRIRPPADPAPLETALSELDGFDWIVFTSRRAVAAVTDRVGVPEAGRPRIAAIGEASAESLERAGWPVDLVPDVQTGAAMLEALRAAGVGSGTRVLFPASAIARDTLPDGLIEAGAVVVQVEAYRTEPAPLDRSACRAALESGAVRILTFTSPSAVENLAAGLGPELTELARSRTRTAVIGPTTASAAEREGFEPIVADPHSLDELAHRVAALAASIDRGGET